jgi:ankyrin repeat protein
LRAAHYGDISKAKELLENGADVNAKDKVEDTALSLAKEGDYSQIVQILKQAGAKE